MPADERSDKTSSSSRVGDANTAFFASSVCSPHFSCPATRRSCPPISARVVRPYYPPLLRAVPEFLIWAISSSRSSTAFEGSASSLVQYDNSHNDRQTQTVRKQRTATTRYPGALVQPSRNFFASRCPSPCLVSKLARGLAPSVHSVEFFHYSLPVIQHPRHPSTSSSLLQQQPQRTARRCRLLLASMRADV